MDAVPIEILVALKFILGGIVVALTAIIIVPVFARILAGILASIFGL